MNTDTLAEAKRRLPLPALMAELGHGDRAKKTARCPFHEDSSASFSLFPGSDGEPRWKCFAGCGQGDAIDFLALARNLSNADACREFIRLAGVTAPPAPAAPSPQRSTVNFQPSFDWPALVAAFTPDHAVKLAEWRGYSPEFVSWLHAQSLVGIFDGERIAFPVHDVTGAVIACHYRRKEDGSWRYDPAGKGTHPLVIGDARTARIVWAFESQWDALAVMDRLGWHLTDGLPDTAVVITRGAENGKLIAGLCAPSATVHAFAQNDPPRADGKPAPAEKWLAELAAHSGCNCVHVVTPQPHKDANDWTREGASTDDLHRVIADAQPVPAPTARPDAPGLHASPPRAITLPPDGDDDPPPAPFPTDALPPTMALMVRAVARTERVPDALPGVIALGILSASIGTGLEVQSGPNRTTRGNLFLLAGAESGSGKSECFRTIAETLLARQALLIDQWQAAAGPKVKAELRALESQLKKLATQTGKTTDPAELDRLMGEMEYRLARQGVLETQSAAPQLVAQDATTERLAVLLQNNAEVIFSTSADARKLCDNLLGRYSANKLTDESLYLCGFSGDHVRVDRQGRDPVTLRRPCLSLLWLVQPDALDLLLNESSLSASGFLPRCLITHTRAEPQRIEGDTAPIADGVRARWSALITELLDAYRLSTTAPAPRQAPQEPL